VYLPAYSPEHNTVEQLFRQLRKRLSNRIFEDLDALHQALIEALQKYWQHPNTLIRLTAYPWWVEGSKYQDHFIVN
jgi:transposase